QIKLEKKFLEYIIKRIERSYGKIYEFIYKVDELSLKKKKPVNLKTIKEIL
ncbi:MAG: DNA replication protein, partial [Proteobacteria bacterium]|nr:DNA replication protein [Pseudomonadota bacterium]